LTQLVLQLLGGFAIRDTAGGEVKLASRKGRALLAYLAMRTGESHSRDRLATLLWEDADDEMARSSLRQALAAIRKSLPDGTHHALIAESNALQLDASLVDTDIAALRRSLSAGTRTSLQDALVRHKGDFLEGFDARSGAYHEWLSQERLALRRQVADAAQKLTTLCAAQDDVDGALLACGRLVALEPLNEAAHRTIMELQARRNAYADALRQYQLCRDILRRELDVAPEPATDSLYRELLRRRRAATADVTNEGEGVRTETREPHAGSTVAEVRRTQLRDAVVLVVRLEGLLELERTLDPEEFHALGADFQRLVQQTVHQFGGESDRRVGANVLSVFGVPLARGNEAERAANAALALQQAARAGTWALPAGVHVRIGISQGQILHNGELFPLAGRPTHSAHALAAGAPDLGVAIADEVRNALGDRVDAYVIDATIPQTTRAWLLVSLHDDRAPDAQPFVGRRPELAMLGAMLERCRTSRRGRAVVVRGEAGIGKTRLVSAVRAAARETGVEVHCSCVFDFGQSLGRRPVTTLALSLLQLGANATPEERQAAVALTTTAAGAAVDQVIFLSDLIDAPLDDELSALENAMEPAIRQRGRSLALSQLLESAARRAPLLIVIEDVHWADQDELARFAEIAAVVAQCPALLLMTTRMQDDPVGAVWRARARGCPVTTVDLAPLAADEAQELAAHYPQLSQSVVQACISRADGNPLFLDQLLRAATAGHDSLPGSIRTLVLARAERLSAQDRNALQAAAVLGQRFSQAALRSMIDSDAYETTSLEQATLVRAEESEIGFAHALIRDAIYESTLRSHRRELHRRAAQWFAERDPALRADHLAAAEDESAADAYITAARTEQAALHFERALTLAGKARIVTRDPLQLHHLNCLLGELLLALGRTHDALTAYRESIDFAPDPARQVEAWVGIASALRVMDRHHEALDALDRAQKALGETQDARMLARITTLYGNVCFPLGRLDACLQAHTQAMQHARAARSPLDLARAYSGLGDAWYQRGRMQTARDYFVRCIVEAQRHNLPGVRLANLPMLAVTHMYCGDVRAANNSFQQALELARHVSDARSELLARIVTAATLLFRGRLDDAEEAARVALALARQIGARRFQAESLSMLAANLLTRGCREESAALIAEALELGRATGMNYCGPSLLGVHARATDNPAECRAALREGEELLSSGCVSHSHFEFYYHAIEVSLRDGQWHEAYRYADALAAYTQEEPLPWTELLIGRGRVLADIGIGRISGETIQTLRQLQSMSLSMDLCLPLPAIDAALARLAQLQS